MTTLVRRLGGAGPAVACSASSRSRAPLRGGRTSGLAPTALAAGSRRRAARARARGERRASRSRSSSPATAPARPPTTPAFVSFTRSTIPVVSRCSPSTRRRARRSKGATARKRRRGTLSPSYSIRGRGARAAGGAEYATEAFILDRSGTVRYHGGIDSDRSHSRRRHAVPPRSARRSPRRQADASRREQSARVCATNDVSRDERSLLGTPRLDRPRGRARRRVQQLPPSERRRGLRGLPRRLVRRGGSQLQEL